MLKYRIFHEPNGAREIDFYFREIWRRAYSWKFSGYAPDQLLSEHENNITKSYVQEALLDEPGTTIQ